MNLRMQLDLNLDVVYSFVPMHALGDIWKLGTGM